MKFPIGLTVRGETQVRKFTIEFQDKVAAPRNDAARSKALELDSQPSASTTIANWVLYIYQDDFHHR